MSEIRLDRREVRTHFVPEVEPRISRELAIVRYEQYVDLVYHLTASPHSYELRLPDTAQEETGLLGMEYLVPHYPNEVTLFARDVIVLTLQAANLRELPRDTTSDDWQRFGEELGYVLTEAALEDVADEDWLNDPRGTPNPFHSPVSIRQLYDEARPKPVDEILGRRSLHPDVISYLRQDG